MKLKALIILALLLIPAVLAIKTFTVKEADLVSILPKGFDPDNDPIIYTFTTPINASGQWQTGYDAAGEYRVTVTATDGKTIASEEVLLAVENVNRPPIIPPIKLTFNEGESISLPLPKLDLDGDEITYRFEEPFNLLGIWQTNFEDAGEYNINLEVTDGEFLEFTIITIIINNLDQPLRLDIPDSLTVNEGEELSVNFEAYDLDGDQVNLTIEGLPEDAQLDHQQLTWTPGFDEIKRSGGIISSFFNSIRLEHKILNKKTIPLSIKACSQQECKEAEINLFVYNVNQKPVIETIPEITLQATEKLSLNVSATDPDGDLLKYYFSEPLGRRNGVWKTQRNDVGEYTIFVTASDGEEQTSLPVNIKVLKDNRNPKLIVNQKAFLVNEGEPIEISLSGKDPDGDNLTFSIEELPSGASFNGSSFTWTPSFETVTEKSSDWENNLISRIAYLNRELNSDKVDQELNLAASDGEIEDKEVVKVMVKNVNRAPKVIDFLPLIDVTVETFEPIIFHVVVKDEDQDKLTYDWSFSLHEPQVKGTDTIERIFVKPGRKKVKVLVSDGSDEVEVTWRVKVVDKETIPLKQDEIEEKFNFYVFEN